MLVVPSGHGGGRTRAYSGDGARGLAATCSFANIAGWVGGQFGCNPVFPGDNHGVATVNNACLPGADDFLVLWVSHSFIMRKPWAMETTLSYLPNEKFKRTESAADSRSGKK